MGPAELVCDLVTAAVQEDGSTLSSFLKSEKRKLRNNTTEMTLEDLKSYPLKVSADPHHILAIARSRIWKRYLEGKNTEEQRKVFTVLFSTTKEWERDVRLPPYPISFEVINTMNERFFTLFERRMKK